MRSHTKVRTAWLCAVALCLLGAPALYAQELLAPNGKVSDYAKLLDESQRETLESQLVELERDTSAEVALVTMGSTGNESIEDYATRLFNTWGIGKKGRDNGVLVLVAVQDRAIRIEVGYGLEGVLPDGLAGAVIRDAFLPRFRDNDYAGGVRAGMAQVIEIVRRNEPLTADQLAVIQRAAAEAGKSWDMAWLFAAFAAVGAFSFGTAAGARVIVQLLFGIGATGAAVYFSTFIVPLTAVWSIALFAVAVAAFGFMLVKRSPKWRRMMRGAGAGSRGSGWISQSTDSSSSSSGSSDSDSSSFGGGSSGGGGATGHW